MSDRPVLASTEPWEKVAVMVPDVMWDQQRQIYRMWYSGGGQYEPDAIGYATSPDGLHWTKHPANPVMRPDPKCPWEQHLVTGAHVVKVGDAYVMFYIGFRDVHHAQIGLAAPRRHQRLAAPQRQSDRPPGRRQVGQRRLLQAHQHLRRAEVAALVQRPPGWCGANGVGHA